MNIDSYKYDVFISYSAHDASVVRVVAKGLRDAGLRVWHSERIDPATAPASDISYGIAHSRVLLLVVSVDSMGEPWPQLEKQTFIFRDPLNQDRRFVPLRLDDVPLPENLRQVEYIDWVQEHAAEIITRLAAVARPPLLKPTSRGLDVPRSTPKRRYKIGAASAIGAIEFDSDKLNVAYGTRNGDIFIIDPDSPKIPKQVLIGHSAPIRSLAFHSSKNLLLSISLDLTVRLWDFQSGKCIRVLAVKNDVVNTARFTGEGLVTSSKQGVINVWDTFDTDVPKELRGHTGDVYSVQAVGNSLVSAGADGTVRVWNLRTGQCHRVLEGHTSGVRSLSLNGRGTLLLTGSDDCTIRLWDLGSGLCLNTYDAHTAPVKLLSWHPSEHFFVSAGEDRSVRLWNLDTGKLLRILDGNDHDVRCIAFGAERMLAADSHQFYEWVLNSSLLPLPSQQILSETAKATEQVQYTNAKVLLVGDSGAGKTGLSKRLAHKQWEASAASTVGAWATQWSIPASIGEHGNKEIWLWDFGGQADQRLIHQLYMDDTALAVLVFDAQKTNVFESLMQWDRDLMRSTDKPLAKLLVAGRIDASPVRVSRQDIQDYISEHGYLNYVETSALTNQGCSDLRDLIVRSIDWDSIPWRSSPVLFKRLKEEIVKLKDEGRVLMRFKELRDALRLRLPPDEVNFGDAELKAVLSLLTGPGVVIELDFGAWVLFQPELINAYSQAVIATMRDDPSELGCVSEQKVLAGDLVYGGFKRIAPEDERIVLFEMHKKLLQRELCAKEITEQDVLLVFPSYYKRNRPELVGHPAVLVSYRFDGVVDEIYSTLVVRLNHTHEFKRAQLWQDAAEFETKSGVKIGVKLNRQLTGTAAASIEVYCDPAAFLGEQIIFVKYVHDHLLQRASHVVRRRHYVCQSCSYPIADLEAADKRRNAGKDDIGCPMCDARVQLIDKLEELYTSAEYQRQVRRLEGLANQELDNESKERVLVGEVISMVAISGQISREKNVSDHGIDMEIEFKNDDRTASGQLLFLQLKSGDSYIRRNADGKEIFMLKNPRHAEYWAGQIAPVMLVVRSSSGEIRWMEIREHLRERLEKGKGAVKQIEFKGTRLDTESIMKWRESLLKNRNQ